VPTREQLEAGWPNSLRKLHAERHGEDHWLAIMVELCERARLRPIPDPKALNAIGCPILLIVGSTDDPRRIRQARVLQEAHDDCQLVVVAGAGHAVHKERPAEVVAAVSDFLGATSAAATPAGIDLRHRGA
jgi:pimeloyl-ACP methyl ester carboxylesterase